MKINTEVYVMQIISCFIYPTLSILLIIEVALLLFVLNLWDGWLGNVWVIGSP